MVYSPVQAETTDTVENVLALLEHHQIRSAPIVNHDNVLVGMFGISSILYSLLPVSARMEDGLRKLNFVTGTMPDVSDRLDAIKNDNVEKHIDADTHVVHADTSLVEAIRILTKYGGPVPVVEKGTGKLEGLVTEQSLLSSIRSSNQEADSNT